MSREFRATLASRSRVLVPRDAPYIAGGVWIYGSTSNVGVIANQLTGWLAGRSTAIVPGTNAVWEPPLTFRQFREWLDRACDVVNKRISTWVVQLPRDRRRRRFNLLLLESSGAPVAFAKFTTNPANPLALEALKRFEDEPTKAFWSPGLLSTDQAGNMTVVMSTPMPNRRHWPAILEPDTRHRILEEIRGRLGDLAYPRAFVHGDFAPWNVRRLAGARIAVVDWEEATKGVAGADALWFVLCSRARADHKVVVNELTAEDRYSETEIVSAARYWLQRLDREEAAEIDPEQEMPAQLDSFSQRLRSMLERIAEA